LARALPGMNRYPKKSQRGKKSAQIAVLRS
jgi:hypothetical protein